MGQPFGNYEAIEAIINPKYYINSSSAQPMHTDEGYTVRFPRYAALYCLRQAAVGGVSIIVDFKKLHEKLNEHFAATIHLLFQHNAIVVKSAYGIKAKPILFNLENDQIGISYSPILKKMWCDYKVFLMFDYITKYIHDPINQIRLKLEPYQAILFDNSQILHGRTSFPKDEKRLLRRYWFEERCL